METLPKDVLILFVIIFGCSTWILSWVIKRLRKEETRIRRKLKSMDRRIKREETLSDKLGSILQEHDIRLDEVDAILEERCAVLTTHRKE